MCNQTVVFPYTSQAMCMASKVSKNISECVFCSLFFLIVIHWAVMLAPQRDKKRRNCLWRTFVAGNSILYVKLPFIVTCRIPLYIASLLAEKNSTISCISFQYRRPGISASSSRLSQSILGASQSLARETSPTPRQITPTIVMRSGTI